MIGERIGPYRVIEMVGIGGMGSVWRATDEFLDRDVALKVVRPELLARPGLGDRFRAEAIVLAKLQHPAIGGLYGVERRGDEFVMVMEFVDGRPLDQLLQARGPFPWPDASRLVRNVLDALEHAHERGVIHRDIKPANVMLTRQGRVKVMDFGIARLVGGQRLTSTGAAVGTPSYMAPEQLLGQEIDGRSDVYAVGTLLFELLTAHVPFEAPGDYLRMIAQLQQDPPAPGTMVAGVPAGLDAIVLRALAKTPEARFESAGAFRDALDALERELGVWRTAVTPVLPLVAVSPITRSGTTPETPLSTAGHVTAIVPSLATPSATGATHGAVAAASSPSGAPHADASALAVETPVPATPPSPVPATTVPVTTVPVTTEPASADVGASLASAASVFASVASAGASTPMPQEAMAHDAAPRATPADSGVADARGSRRARPFIAAALVVLVGIAAWSLRGGDRAGTTGIAAVAAADSAAARAALPLTPDPATLATPVDSNVIRDSIALEQRAAAVAESLRAERVRDSVVARARDSASAASRGVSALTTATRAAARRCIEIMDTRDLAALPQLLGGKRDRILALAKDGRLAATGPLGVEVEPDVDRTVVRFGALLQGAPRRAELRAILERDGERWTLRSCVVDDDGGLR
jgi:serine/threonine-protein kinase